MPNQRVQSPTQNEAGQREIARQIDLLADALARVPGVRSVVLMGSAARDELAWTMLGDRPQLFSDLEFLAVTETRLPAQARREAEATLKRIAAGFGQRSPLFHVDVLFREIERIPKLPRIVFTFELASLGKTLRGPGALDGLPEIHARNLDLKNTREILMKRLWAIAERIPMPLFQGETLDEVEARTLGALLWRNPLDVPTVLLPCAGILEAGYARRARSWSRNPKLPFRRHIDTHLGRDSAVYLRDCLALRRDCAPAQNAAASHRDTITFIVAALDWLARLSGGGPSIDGGKFDAAMIDGSRIDGDRIDDLRAEHGRIDDARLKQTGSEAHRLDEDWLEDVAERVIATSGRLFNARPISRGEWLALATQGVRLANRGGPRASLRWWTGRRKGQLCAALIHLHQALPHVLDPNMKAARVALDQSMACCEAILPLEPVLARAYREAEDPASAFLAARAQVARLFWRVVRLGDAGAWRHIVKSIELPPEWS